MQKLNEEYKKNLSDFFMSQIEQKLLSDLFNNNFAINQNEVVSYMISKGDLKYQVRDIISFYLWVFGRRKKGINNMQKLYNHYLKIAQVLVQDYETLLAQYREQGKPSEFTALRIYEWNKKINKVKKKIKVLNQ